MRPGSRQACAAPRHCDPGAAGIVLSLRWPVAEEKPAYERTNLVTRRPPTARLGQLLSTGTKWAKHMFSVFYRPVCGRAPLESPRSRMLLVLEDLRTPR